ncbi:CiaD-like domain-containing protein [Sulfurimonas sp.]
MELKDVILSTLAEMEEVTTNVQDTEFEVKEMLSPKTKKTTPKIEIPTPKEEVKESSNESELMYLNSIRERLLVLFEGFQAPNNTNIEAKIDMTLNFLEYVLATIDKRVERLEKGTK